MKLTQPLSVAAAAELLGCTYAGDPHRLITGINEIHMVEPGDLTFVDVEKYYRKALESAATIVLINQPVAPPEGKSLLVSDDPFRDYNRLTEYFQPRSPLNREGQPVLGENVKIGRNVVFGEDVEIGEGSEIGHNVVIGSHVRIGKGCLIHANVTLYDHVILGEEVCINSGTVLGGEAFYFKARPYGRDKLLTKGRVVIGDHVDIGANCTIDRGVSGDTVIGAWTKLDNLIQIGHDTVIGRRCVIASQTGIAGVSVVEDDVVLWGQVGVVKEVVIGKGAVVLAKSGVGRSLDAGGVYSGWMAHEHRQKLKEEAALRKLPGLLKKLE